MHVTHHVTHLKREVGSIAVDVGRPTQTLYRSGPFSAYPALIGGDVDELVEPDFTVIISRSLTKELGTQTHVPHRFLLGIMPTALVEQYVLFVYSAAQPLPFSLFFWPQPVSVVRIFPNLLHTPYEPPVHQTRRTRPPDTRHSCMLVY
jgi:hypothetical protein